MNNADLQGHIIHKAEKVVAYQPHRFNLPLLGELKGPGVRPWVNTALQVCVTHSWDLAPVIVLLVQMHEF